MERTHHSLIDRFRRAVVAAAVVAGAASVFGCGPAEGPAIADPRIFDRSCVDAAKAVAHEVPRVIRYKSEKLPCGDDYCFGLVLTLENGLPARVFNLTKWRPLLGSTLAEFLRTADEYDPDGFDFARRLWTRHTEAIDKGGLKSIRQLRYWIEDLDPETVEASLGPVFDASLERFKAGEQIGIGVGLNYRAHAEEAGGGDMFLFPKAVVPTRGNDPVRPDGDVELLDYEIELGFLVLDDIPLDALPDDETLQGKLAYFTANDVTARAPIFKERRRGFADAKSRPSFLPTGPWMVRGSELGVFGAGGRSLALGLDVIEGDVTSCRQSADTGLLLEEPLGVLQMLAKQVRKRGVYAEAPRNLAGEVVLYPLAVERELDGETRFVLPRGSFVLTGTPGGTAAKKPDPAAMMRLVYKAVQTRKWSPAGVFLEEQIANREKAGYLADGDVVHAYVEGLGVQRFEIDWPARAGGR